MARQTINVGATANDGTGDGIRTAYIKCNDNFKELFDSTVTPTELTNGTSNIAVADSANVTISIAGSSNVTTFGLQETTIGGNVTIATDLDIGNSLTISQDFTIGDQLIINGSVGSNILPDTNNARTLGNATLRFAETNTVLVSASGNITSGANIAGANIIATQDVIIAGQHVTTGNVTSSGNISGGNLLTGGRVVATGNLVTSGQVVATGNITGLNITASGSGNITAGGFLVGDGGFLSNVTAASNVAVTQIANGTSVVGISSSGGNVELTSGGTLAFQTNGTNLDVIIPITSANITAATGNISGGNLLTGGRVVSTGNIVSSANISAVNFLGNGSFLTGVASTSITNGTSNVSVASNADTTVGVAGTTRLTIAATGTTVAGVMTATGNITATGNVAGGNVVTGGAVIGATVAGDGSALTALNGTNISSGTVAAARVATLNQNTTGSAATLTTARAIALTGAVTGTADFDGSAGISITTTNTADPTITLTGDVTGSGTMTNLGSVSFATTIAANSVALGTDTTGNYVAAGAVSGIGLSGSAGAEGATFTVASNATDANTASTIVARDGSGNFTAGTITALATSAQYADVAEMYLSDQEYEPGTVITIGGVYEITICGLGAYPAGVVSTDPAYLMNSSLTAGLPIALVGRVPVRIFGSVMKGQKVYSDLMGRASKNSEGALVGISLEDNSDPGEKLVECMLKV
jgi:filamentous hemagglutinin